MKMSRSKVAVVSVVAAAAMVALVPAEASAGHHGGGMRVGGGMMRMSAGNHHHHHHRRHFRPIYVAPVVTERVYSQRRTTTGVTPKPALVRFADGKGRIYDPASGVWFDGKSSCWAGKAQWTFKTGAWFYGSYRWYEAGGLWQTDAPESPAAVDCATVPVFAAKLQPASDSKGGRKEMVENADQPERAIEAPKVKTAQKGAAEKPEKAAECKKYFPSVGVTLPVPCE